jgi:KipI family sensor histidine kinase inhibitor
MTIEALGDRAIRFPRPSGPSARAIVAAATRWPGAVDVVVTRDDVAVYFENAASFAPSRVDPAWIAALASARDEGEPPREHELRVVYDGADLEDIARATGLTVADVITRHQAATYTVDTMGFAPGFAYLDGLDLSLELPRRATPRERVPAGSVAIAGRQTAVYPFDSPGGWHLVGRVVDVRMFDPVCGPLLALGDRVRFRA